MSEEKKSPFWKSIQSRIRLQHQACVVKTIEREPNTPLPLSFGQERLWYVDQLNPGSIAHNLRAVFHLQGDLDQSVLIKSLKEIVRRHEILRTTFPVKDGKPVQMISTDVNLDMTSISIMHLSEKEQGIEIERLATEEVQQPFNLSKDSLLRLKLVQVNQDEHILLRTTHHIINDRWSDSLFMRELATLYKTFLEQSLPKNSAQANIQHTIPPLTVQYGDFALFQRKWMGNSDLVASQIEYWRGELDKIETIEHLNEDHPHSCLTHYHGGTQYLPLSRELTHSLQKLSQSEGVSLFVTLMAAFNALLFQYSGQKDIVICSPVSGRTQVELRKIIGYFNNLLPIRTNLEGNPDFRRLQHQVSEVSLKAFENQDIPIHHLAELLDIPGAALSRAMFTLQNVPSYPEKMGEVTITPMDIEEGISNFDLSLSMKISDHQLKCVMRYSKDLFEDITIISMLEQFQILLEKIVQNPEIKIGDLSDFTKRVRVNSSSSSPGGSHLSSYSSAASPDNYKATEVERYLPPGEQIEQDIAQIWQSILKKERISINSNFFDMGGRSLAMVQLCSRLEKHFNIKISIKALLQDPTIRGMGHYLSQIGIVCNSKSTKTAVPTEIVQTGISPGSQISNRVQRQKEALKRQNRLLKQRRDLNG